MNRSQQLTPYSLLPTPARGRRGGDEGSAVSIPEALAFHMLGQFGMDLLPLAISSSLQPYFSAVKHQLAQNIGTGAARNWVSKVRVVAPDQPLLAPHISGLVLKSVHHALMHNYCLRLRYREKSASERLVHPLGLVQHGKVFYLLVHYHGYPDIRLLALQRVRAAEVDACAVVVPASFDLDNINEAAALIRAADGLLITAGAGIGVDSGLPDFRGDEGFWKAYPPLAKAGIKFTSIANPAAFRADPRRAWGFYGHRLQLYRDTVPHEGFAILRAIAAGMRHGSFIFTSNVDGQFQKAGLDAERIVECHGSIHHLQCIDACTNAIWPADKIAPLVDTEHCQMTSELPLCSHCGKLARPNVLMFNDTHWLDGRTEAQDRRFDAWLKTVRRPVVLEMGAGTNIPSVRHQGEAIDAPLIRINPREPNVRRATDIGLAMGALNGLRRIQEALKSGK